MADYAAKVVNMARILAIVHIVVGSMLICFGIADIALQYYWIGFGGWGIWMGSWMCVAGGLGIPGTRKERNTSRNCFAGVFMGFSITSAVFGGGIIIIYSIGIAAYGRYWYGYGYYKYDTQMAIMALILILGIVEFAIGIWASVCLCLMKPCTCCYGTPPQQPQVMYTVNSGNAMNPFSVGTSTTIPMQNGGGMVTVPAATPGSQQVQSHIVMVPVSGAGAGMVTTQSMTARSFGSPPQVVMVPVSGALAYPPQLVHAPTSNAIPEPTATAHQPRQVEML